jgi:hypothetical protein
MTRPDFVDVLKQGKDFSGVRDLLRITGVQIPILIFWLPPGPPLGSTKGAPAEVHYRTELGCVARVTFFNN